MALVDVTSTLAVSEKLLDGLSICTGCRGSGQRWAWAGWTAFRVGRPYLCVRCCGRGFFSDAPQ